MPRGVSFPDLSKKIIWRDDVNRSEATVHTISSGYVQLVLNRYRGRWRWASYGWLGVLLATGEKTYPERESAKGACLTWWGRMTAADRSEITTLDSA